MSRCCNPGGATATHCAKKFRKFRPIFAEPGATNAWRYGTPRALPLADGSFGSLLELAFFLVRQPWHELVGELSPSLDSESQLRIVQEARIESTAKLSLIDLSPDDDDLLSAIAERLLRIGFDLSADFRIVGPLVATDSGPPRAST